MCSSLKSALPAGVGCPPPEDCWCQWAASPNGTLQSVQPEYQRKVCEEHSERAERQLAMSLMVNENGNQVVC